MQSWRKLQWPTAALALVLLFNLVFTHGFFRIELKDGRLFGSLIDILNRGTPVGLLALGMTLVIATGGIDLRFDDGILAFLNAIQKMLSRTTSNCARPW